MKRIILPFRIGTRKQAIYVSETTKSKCSGHLLSDTCRDSRCGNCRQTAAKRRLAPVDRRTVANLTVSTFEEP